MAISFSLSTQKHLKTRNFFFFFFFFFLTRAIFIMNQNTNADATLYTCFKSLLLKMAATVMTVEFGTIHHYSSVEKNSEACLCSSLNR